MKFLALAAMCGLASGLSARQKLERRIAHQTESLSPGIKAMTQAFTKTLLDSRPQEVWEAAGALSSTDSQWCNSSSYWEFVPVSVATVSQAAPSASWAGDGCFTGMSASVTFNSTGASISLSGTGATGLFCSDTYLVATSYSIAMVDVSALAPTGTTGFAAWQSQQEVLDVHLNGLAIYVLPCGLLGTVNSLLKTIGLFSNSNYTAMVQANLDFLTERKVWPSPLKPFGQYTQVDMNSIQSGDYLAISRLDGLDPMIMFGVGGVTGHSAIAVWEGSGANRTLYVCESTDANPTGPVYWPPPYGMIRHDWNTWVRLAQGANYTVSVLPLAPQYASAFNESSFWQWFYGVQGMAYGYHTMLPSFLDTHDPQMNMPLPFNNALLTTVLNIVDSAGLLPNTTTGVSIYSMLTWGLNKRLGTSCDSLACIIEVVNSNKAAGASPASFSEAIAIPDQDSWMFGANYSMVCSQFAAHGWRAGLGGAFPIFASQYLANEQTPKDNYQQALYDPARWTSTNCPGGVITSPNNAGAYCQIMGLYVQELNGYNSIPLYPNINNGCASQWPNYVRCPDGSSTCQC